MCDEIRDCILFATDPEEFLNMLFKHTLHVNPFIQIKYVLTACVCVCVCVCVCTHVHACGCGCVCVC